MRPFLYESATDMPGALKSGLSNADAANRAPTQFLAGGTTMIDLMKLDVMQPSKLVDIRKLNDPALRGVQATSQGLRIGALVTMAEAAEHEAIKRDYPVLSESLWMAASQQLRIMATVGGNVLQRTRCNYFRDVSYANCNKRNPGSGCAAIDGVNRLHAVLGGSDQCIAVYPGDWAQGMIALDAQVEIASERGRRSIPFAELHREPGTTPHIETVLRPGELITAFTVPAGPHTRRSLYLKIRDRESYAFALTSAAIALALDGDKVTDVRIAVGGVATKPWRVKVAEDSLRGQPLNEATALRAAQAAFAGAKPQKYSEFKVRLGQQTVVRALLKARALEV
ncbi:MAG: xanthine dehydrogenase family protein subunit M [Hyphomicrobiales bacterium]|nr:xanthine dehydrogenase family protein subunit M [Hyphomicrobiales bacterium]